jgi:hypothetical protein
MILIQHVPHWKIEGTHVGPVHIGMSASQLKKIAKDKRNHIRIRAVTWESDADDSSRHGYDLMSGKSRLMRVELDGGPIWSIDVYDSRFTTRAGIHPNSTLRDAVKAYGPGAVDAGDNTISLSFSDKPTLDFILADYKGLDHGHVELHSLRKVTPRITAIQIHSAD